MTLDEYEKEAMRTSTPRSFLPEVMALGLCGESGEFADLVKKDLAQGHPLDVNKALRELGDVLWYVAGAACVLGSSLEQVARLNIDKLRARYPDGFSTERSLNR